MKMKKVYAVPALDILELEGEHLLSGSRTDVNISDEVTKDDASMTNKKGSWNHTWE
ncbi:MAG: hypothetical protein IKT92_01495 [Bacteroidaceae bacterium]|nr:hypothetical protein [Bacteroidaceae bacterium]